MFLALRMPSQRTTNIRLGQVTLGCCFLNLNTQEEKTSNAGTTDLWKNSHLTTQILLG